MGVGAGMGLINEGILEYKYYLFYLTPQGHRMLSDSKYKYNDEEA